MRAIQLILVAAMGTSSAVSLADGFRVTTSKKVTVAAASLGLAEKKATPAKVSLDKKTLTYSGKDVRLVVRTGPDNDMMSYRIKELRNPTLVIPAGSNLRILFVNSDEDMLHNFRLTDTMPPFGPKPGAIGAGSSDLPHEMHGKYTGQEMTFKVPTRPGTYRYVCTISGHAAAGMFGTLIVK